MTTAQPIQTIAQAVAAVGERISPVRHEQIDWSDAPGRVLAARTRLDRPSPACDVSAMDGYALSFLQTHNRPLRVHSTSTPGVQAPPMPDDADAVVRIFTGAMVPRGTRAIVQRELVIESGQTITLTEKATLREGQNIRHAGENAPADLSFAEPGAIVTPGVLAGLAACGHERLSVYRPLRVAVLVTGDEVLPIDTKPEPWQLRDSNGPALRAMLASIPWIGTITHTTERDHHNTLRNTAQQLIESHDALLVTGGISAGDHDHVPAVLREIGVKKVFHKLAIRPGKPVFGGVTPDGKPVMGLPGNPVSVMVTARLLALPALLARAGTGGGAMPPTPMVQINETATAPPHLWWYPLVRHVAVGRTELVPGNGSGDWVAAAGSVGFIEVPPGEPAQGLRPFHAW